MAEVFAGVLLTDTDPSVYSMSARQSSPALTSGQILEELHALGSEGTRRVLMNHGAADPCLGVKIGDLQKIRKRAGKDYPLALALWDSGIYDARYLAGLITDDALMTAADLRHWLHSACRPLATTILAGVAAGSPHGYPLALEWVGSADEKTAATGWATLSGIVSVKPDSELDLKTLRSLLVRVEREIHAAANQVRYTMNGFLISAGASISAFTGEALAIAGRIGPVTVDMGPTACQVPEAAGYIRKIQERGTIGKKRQSAKC